MSVYIAKPADGIAWITGASSGLGYKAATLLAQLGWTVAATARNLGELKKLEEECADYSGNVVAVAGDVTDQAQMVDICEKLVSDHGHIALVVLNAGVYLPLRANELKLEDFDKTFSVNLNGVTNCLVPVLEHMGASGRGQVAITSSVAGYGGLPTSAAYGATKAALTNMAASLKFDLDLMNIHIQIVHPGFVDTPATESNPFPMPFLMDVDDAAKRLVKGLKSKSFEITFPKRFTYWLKAINLLPYPVYFWIIKRATGWNDKNF
ncbi:MAG: SDR family NAD(P)-dependent oxidoreductase [Hyphomicrobiales bacterium]